MHAVGYARISIEDQSQNSIPGQIAEITAYCRRNNLNLHQIFVDNGQSAFNFQRKEWRQVERYLKDHREVRYLVITAMDRFSRANLAEALVKMDEIQTRTGVKILTVADPLNLDPTDFGTDLRRVMELLFSNYELKKIRKRTSDGMYQAMSTGRWVNTAPYGYRFARDPNGKPVLAIEDDKAYIVRLIFRRYLAGQDIEEIRKGAKAAGFKLRGNSAIKRILSNPIYAALISLPKRGQEPAKMVKAIHPPIITESDYWQVQERLNEKTRATQKSSTVYLKGSLYCHCGRRMSSDRVRGKSGKHYQYYLCPDHRVNVSAIKAHERFDAILSCLSLPEEIADLTIKALKRIIDEKAGSQSSDLMRANVALQKVRDKISATQEKYLLQSDISESVYKKVIGSLYADESRLVAEVAELQSSGQNQYDMLSQVMPLLSDTRQLFHRLTQERKAGFISVVFGKITVTPNGSFRTPFLSPLFRHSELIMKEKWLIEIDQPGEEIAKNGGGSPYGNLLEHLASLHRLLVA